VRIGLFVTCLVDVMRPRIGFAALRLLQSTGHEVVVPPSQTCCGQPGYNSGDRRSAQLLALKVLDEFRDCDYVVAPSGSCSGMIRTHYPDLLREFPERSKDVEVLCAKTYELTDFLVNVAGLDRVPGTRRGTITYHDSCAGLREMGIKRQPRALLESMEGLRITEMESAEQCCGFGGTFAVKFGEVSTRIADRKCDAVESAGADALVLGDLGCMLNIEGRMRRRGNRHTRVLHVAEVLAGMDGDAVD
jgi:L-lactate dehydrogenase complex protein LldE